MARRQSVRARRGRPAGRDRPGRVRYAAPDLPASSTRQRRDRAGPASDRHRAGHPGRADGPAGPRPLRPGLRRVQGGHRPGADRPGDRPPQPAASAAARPPPRSSSASRRRSWPDDSSAGAARPCADGSSSARRTRLVPRSDPARSRAATRGEAAGAADTTRDSIAASVPRRRTGGDPVHQRQHRPAQGGGLHARHPQRPGRASSATLFDIEPGEVDLCTFPLFALFAPALGMSSIVPEMDPTRPARVNPARIVEADRRLRRDEPVRLAGPAPPARPGR